MNKAALENALISPSAVPAPAGSVRRSAVRSTSAHAVSSELAQRSAPVADLPTELHVKKPWSGKRKALVAVGVCFFFGLI